MGYSIAELLAEGRITTGNGLKIYPKQAEATRPRGLKAIPDKVLRRTDISQLPAEHNVEFRGLDKGKAVLVNTTNLCSPACPQQNIKIQFIVDPNRQCFEPYTEPTPEQQAINRLSYQISQVDGQIEQARKSEAAMIALLVTPDQSGWIPIFPTGTTMVVSASRDIIINLEQQKIQLQQQLTKLTQPLTK